MISLDKLRELEPTLKDLSDDEVFEIRERLYQMAQLAYERWIDENGSKIPVGLTDLPENLD